MDVSLICFTESQLLLGLQLSLCSRQHDDQRTAQGSRTPLCHMRPNISVLLFKWAGTGACPKIATLTLHSAQYEWFDAVELHIRCQVQVLSGVLVNLKTTLSKDFYVKCLNDDGYVSHSEGKSITCEDYMFSLEPDLHILMRGSLKCDCAIHSSWAGKYWGSKRVWERSSLFKKNKLGNNDIWALVSFVNKTFANAET